MVKIDVEDRYCKLERSLKNLFVKLCMVYSRMQAHKYRKEVVKRYGRSVINRQVKKTMKEYARERFGKTSYWPYLALYTEIRGEFIEEWLPVDYYKYVLLPRINPKPSSYLSEHKTFDYRIFGDFAVKPLFLFISGMFLNPDLEVSEDNQVKKFLSDYNNNIVIKEESGCQGKQVSIIHSSEFIPEKLKRNVNYIIQPYIKQYKVLNDLYPESLNTFRVTTYLKDDGSVDIKFVILKFGLDGVKVDNMAAGGHHIYFDISGKPSTFGYDKYGFESGERHKNTGYLYSNVKIPMFNKMIEKCKNAHKKYPYVRLIGWDVCIDDSGEPKLVEWNVDNPGFWIFEAKCGPMWTDDNEVKP